MLCSTITIALQANSLQHCQQTANSHPSIPHLTHSLQPCQPTANSPSNLLACPPPPRLKPTALPADSRQPS